MHISVNKTRVAKHLDLKRDIDGKDYIFDQIGQFVQVFLLNLSGVQVPESGQDQANITADPGPYRRGLVQQDTEVEVHDALPIVVPDIIFLLEVALGRPKSRTTRHSISRRK